MFPLHGSLAISEYTAIKAAAKIQFFGRLAKCAHKEDTVVLFLIADLIDTFYVS
jgi:hypothetical protein